MIVISNRMIPIRSLPGDLPTPSNLVTQINDRSVSLSWEVTGAANVNRYRIYSSKQADQFELLDSSATLSIRLDNLPPNETIKLGVTAVNATGIEGEMSESVTVVVGLLSISINSSDLLTNRRDVNILINAPSTAAFVVMSEDSLFADGSQPVPVPSQLAFTLSQGDGLKTVYARFSFDNGSESGDLISDDITLDTRAIIDSVTYTPSGQTFATGSNIQFLLYAAGELGGRGIGFISRSLRYSSA